jgi:hypothetical protein
MVDFTGDNPGELKAVVRTAKVQFALSIANDFREEQLQSSSIEIKVGRVRAEYQDDFHKLGDQGKKLIELRQEIQDYRDLRKDTKIPKAEKEAKLKELLVNIRTHADDLKKVFIDLQQETKDPSPLRRQYQRIIDRLEELRTNADKGTLSDKDSTACNSLLKTVEEAQTYIANMVKRLWNSTFSPSGQGNQVDYNLITLSQIKPTALQKSDQRQVRIPLILFASSQERENLEQEINEKLLLYYSAEAVRHQKEKKQHVNEDCEDKKKLKHDLQELLFNSNVPQDMRFLLLEKLVFVADVPGNNVVDLVGPIIENYKRMRRQGSAAVSI